jgi:hypothetical protein
VIEVKAITQEGKLVTANGSHGLRGKPMLSLWRPVFSRIQGWQQMQARKRGAEANDLCGSGDGDEPS